MKVKKIGWIRDVSCGCTQKSLEWQYTDVKTLCSQLLKDNVLNYPIENFGRLNQDSRKVALAVALALYDANISYTKGSKQNIGILGTSLDGALEPNFAYFRDYVEAGRKLGRGKLFIYTLPSSPLAESMIHFGLQGPISYMRNVEKPEEDLLAQAKLLVQDKAAEAILVVSFGINGATCECIQGVEV